MMLGEMDFGDMLAQHVTKTGITPSFLMPYPVFTAIYFVVFVALISMLLMNLLIGVSIDNVSGVADSATLQRISMQLKASLDTEFIFKKLAKKWTIKEEVVKPNEQRSLLNKIMASVIGDGLLLKIKQNFSKNIEQGGAKWVSKSLRKLSSQTAQDTQQCNFLDRIRMRWRQSRIS